MTARAAALHAEDAALARAHPLTSFGFDALVAGAARPRPGALAFRDSHGGAIDDVSYADLYQSIGAAVAQLRAFEFPRGARMLVCCPPGAQSFVAVAAALAAGLEPVLSPLPLPYSRDAIAHAARTLAVAGLFAPARFCGVDFEATLLEIASGAPSVRLLATLGGTMDGAVDFSPAALQSTGSPRIRLADDWSADERAQIGALDDMGAVDFASQGALLGAALDLVRATRAAGAAPILSLCAPSSLGALVAGPLAALLAGAPLHFLAPFEAARFLETLDALGPARLVAPASVISDLARSGLLASGALASVAALCPKGGASNLEVDAACPMIELSVAGALLGIRGATHAPAHAETLDPGPK